MTLDKILVAIFSLAGIVSLGSVGLGLPLLSFKHRAAKIDCNINLLNHVALKDYLNLQGVSNKEPGTFKYKEPSAECASYPFTEDRYNFGGLSICDNDGIVDRAFCAGISDGAPYRFVWEIK